jgi:hypothetical protein
MLICALCSLALNNYRLRSDKARWKWDEEVAVITGGCGGLGVILAKRLTDKGVKVAILDIQALPESLKDSQLAPQFTQHPPLLLTCVSRPQRQILPMRRDRPISHPIRRPGHQSSSRRALHPSEQLRHRASSYRARLSTGLPCQSLWREFV